MKKILTTIMCFAAGAGVVLAQGYVSFQNLGAKVQTNTTPFAIGYPSTTGATSGYMAVPSSGQLYEFVLLAATSTTSADYGNPAGPDWTVVDYYNTSTIAYGTNYSLVGTGGGTSGPNRANGFSCSLYAATTYEMMVVGWSANLGTWQTVLSDIKGQSEWLNFGYVGYSNVGTIDPTAAEPGATIFAGSGAQPGQTILYYDVPEPASLALMGLGGLALLLFRRRQ